MSMTLQSTYTSFPPIAFAGQLEGLAKDVQTMVNATTSTSMPFGSAVKLKGTQTTDKDVDVISASTDQVFGLIAYSTAYTRQWTDSDGNKHGDLDSTGLVPGVFLNVLRTGRIAVLVHSTTAPGNNLHVCHTAGTTYTAAGQMGGAAETNKSLKVSATQFLTSAVSGGFAWLDCDFVASTSTADT